MVDFTSSSLFLADFYIRHNQRRLEHLASLGLDLFNKTVLEPGAGIGDHTLFYLDRGCHVTAVEPRTQNCEAFREKIKNSFTPNNQNYTLIQAPVDTIEDMTEMFDITHCYGLLYHVGNPAEVIASLSKRTKKYLLLETCVSMDKAMEINLVQEPVENPAQALKGEGCRPSRPWLMREISKHFKHVYVPKTQPAHDEFPTDWSKPWPSQFGLYRAVFIGSNEKLNNPFFTNKLPDHQPWTIKHNT